MWSLIGWQGAQVVERDAADEAAAGTAIVGAEEGLAVEHGCGGGYVGEAADLADQRLVVVEFLAGVGPSIVMWPFTPRMRDTSST